MRSSLATSALRLLQSSLFADFFPAVSDRAVCNVYANETKLLGYTSCGYVHRGGGRMAFDSRKPHPTRERGAGPVAPDLVSPTPAKTPEREEVVLELSVTAPHGA
jgi:hypothetical protein